MAGSGLHSDITHEWSLICLMKNWDKLFLPLNIPDCSWAVITFSRFNNRGKWIDKGKYILLLLVVMCTHVKVSREDINRN